MNDKLRWILVLSAVGLVVIGILGALGLAWRAMEIGRQFQPAKLVDLDKNKINDITLNFRAQPPIQLIREGDAWWMINPIHGPADVANTLIIRETLFEMQVTRRFAAGAADCPDAETTGLLRPRAVLSIGDSEGRRLQMAILNFVPRRKETYVKVFGSDELLCVSPDPMDILKKSYGVYRSEKLLGLSAEQLNGAVEIIAEGRGGFHLSRRGGSWRFTPDSPYAGYAARNEGVEALLKALAEITVCGFLTEAPTDPTDFGLDAPWQRYQLLFDDGGEARRLDVALIARAGGMFATVNGEPWPVQIRPEDGRAAVVEAGDLLAKRLLNLKPQEMAGLTVHAAARSVAFVRAPDGNGWLDAEGLPAPVQLPILLEELAGLGFDSVISGYATLEGFGLDNPRLIVDITMADGGLLTLKVGSTSPAAGRVYLKSSDRTSVFTVDAAIINRLEALADGS